jgi:hypothetical protein
LQEAPELEDFKTRIDLRSYAAAEGYQEDTRHNPRRIETRSTCMRHPVTDDKIFVGLNKNHYVYWSVRDSADNGTIIDFVKRRKRMSLGAIRKELRPWIGQRPVPVPSFPLLRRTEKNRMNVEAAYARMQDAVNGHPYLERERALPGALLALNRFAGRVRIDDRGNAVFPHFDEDGLSGYEIKNTGFTGFASGGSKALWLSQQLPNDNRLVFTESAIDGLSHAVLFPDNRARYASIGGKTNPQQPELIRAAVARMPHSSEIVSAMDADANGHELAEIVRRAVELSGRLDLKFTVHEPAGHKDFNDQLRARPYPLLSYRLEVPSVGRIVDPGRYEYRVHKFMKTNDQVKKAKRADRIIEVAQEIFEREAKKAQAEGVLEAPDIVSVFAGACVMTVLALKEYSDDLANDLAGTALRTIINNLAVQGVNIPEL